jgi:hypothetical protein
MKKFIKKKMIFKINLEYWLSGKDGKNKKDLLREVLVSSKGLSTKKTFERFLGSRIKKKCSRKKASLYSR